MRREIGILAHRLRSGLESERRELGLAPCSDCPAERRLGMAFEPGERAIDLTTGEEVIVRGGKRENVAVRTPERQNG